MDFGPMLSKALFLIVFVLENSKQATVYVKHSSFGDQGGSASGYAYEVKSGHPVSYTSYSVDSDDRGYQGKPLTRTQRYSDNAAHELPLETLNYYSQVVDDQYVPQYEVYSYPHLFEEYHDGDLESIPQYGYPYFGLQFPHYPHFASAPKYPYYTGGLYYPHYVGGVKEDDSSYKKDVGEKHQDAFSASKGNKGESAYKNVEQYDKGEKGKHDHQVNKGHYAQEGGNKANHYDVGEHYKKNEAAAKGSKGEHYHQSSGHKKGSKTSGYHRVYHKDEYKKDHSFYDESNNEGSYNKHSDSDAKQASEQGGYEKGGKDVSGYQVAQHGASGAEDKGSFSDSSSGYKGRKGEDSYYKDASDYAHKDDRADSNQYGYLGHENFHPFN